MSLPAEENRSGDHQAETGPSPYFHRSDCNICRKQDGLKTGSELLDAPRPAGYIVERELFLAEHAPQQSASAGTVIVEARRHLLDFGEMKPDELAELGSILHRLVPAVKAATGVQRVYFLALMERAPHFHLWLVPKKGEGGTSGSGLSGAAATSYVVARRGSSNVGKDPRAIRSFLTAVPV
jgi:diadenosine tetraphosphate (Ap4A) HIT family hydrolase